MEWLYKHLKSDSHFPKKFAWFAFYFILKAFFVLKIIEFLSWLFGHVDKVNFKIYDVTIWLTNNRNTHIAQYLRK